MSLKAGSYSPGRNVYGHCPAHLPCILRPLISRSHQHNLKQRCRVLRCAAVQAMMNQKTMMNQRLLNNRLDNADITHRQEQIA